LNALERVESKAGQAYDFLSSIYRLTNDERLTKYFDELTPGYRTVAELSSRVRTTRDSFPPTTRGKWNFTLIGKLLLKCE